MIGRRRIRDERAGWSLPGVVALGAWLAIAACSAQTRPAAAEPRGQQATRNSAAEPDPPASKVNVGATQRGKASWYGTRYHGRKTASGERFDKDALTAAHRTLPFGTVVRVKNLSNGETVEVRVTDRGPFRKKQRIIDLSEAAARRLRMISAGVVPVVLEVIALPAAR